MTQGRHHEKIQDFIAELSGFAQTAEDTLKQIEADMLANKGLFSVFTARMFAIRGTAQQLALPHIANIAGLGEEIAIKAAAADTRPQIRKAVGALWDALTTVKYLLEHYTEETGEEQDILVNRLQSTLKAFGGARPTVSADEIEALLSGAFGGEKK
jgi:hypothetical protein